MWFMLNIDENILNKNYNIEICKLAKSKFHTQILELWSKLHDTDPTHKQDILNEYLLYNKNIVINRKMLDPCYFGNGCNKNVEIMDLYTQEGKIVSQPIAEKAIMTKLTILKYNSLKTILPQHWRNKLKGQNPTDPIIRRSNQPLVKINMLWKPINIITSKNINLKMVGSKISRPTAQDTWINIFPFLENLEWDKIYIHYHIKSHGNPFSRAFNLKSTIEF